MKKTGKGKERKREESGKNYISSLKLKFDKNGRKFYISAQQKNIFLNAVNSLFL
jgi:hypothetical protein